MSRRTAARGRSPASLGYTGGMRSRLVLAALLVVACEAKQPASETPPKPDSDANAQSPTAEPEPEPEPQRPNDVVLDHQVKLLDGGDKNLADYRGKALLVVNTASECGFTPQYAGLQQLYAKYQDAGLEVLAFPSNDFGAQEPGTPEQIDAFVHGGEFDVEFVMFDKVATKGPDQAPIYKTLTEDTGEGIKGEIAWNFTKFLVAPDGRVIRRFEPPVDPMDPELVAAVEAALPHG